jgi:hypothetical protein
MMDDSNTAAGSIRTSRSGPTAPLIASLAQEIRLLARDYPAWRASLGSGLK